MQYIAGVEKVMNNLMRQKDKNLDQISEAVDQSALKVANHAKAGHVGAMAHADQRYQNQTGTLTRSITPQLTKVRFKIIEAQVFSNVEYAPNVELGTGKTQPYPFLFPALQANQEDFKARVAKAAKP